ncbi:glycosyltransferase [Spongiibacter sp. KMU-158]|uniref:Glycosyltransferase n=1 Tax=Spongiibacter pelagi TaxID=2760804 RepID=A0A927GWR5_9GAMM|nr:glycosyltransferase [Spongiibacter pelagi]MBD2859383.1 glycosyltransferase [Spongiibacter pelagi]
MKVCQFLSAGTGGLAKHVIDLSNSLSVGGHDVCAITPVESSRELDSKIVHVDIKPEKKIKSLLYTFKLFLAIRKLNPDVVHAHGKNSSVHLARIKPFIRAKCVGTIHWHQKRERDFRGFEKMDGVIGVGPGVFGPLKNKSRIVIYNGISEIQNFDMPKSEFLESWDLDSTLPMAVAVGMLSRGKGFHLLVEAWQGVEANLVIAGEGPERQQLIGQVSELGLEGRIRLVGQIPEASRLLRIADLAIVSSYKEGFSYVVAEALLSKTPIISTKMDGADVLLPSEALVPVGDVGAINNKIREFFSNPSRFEKNFKKLFFWAEHELLLEKMREKTLCFYKSLED